MGVRIIPGAKLHGEEKNTANDATALAASGIPPCRRRVATAEGAVPRRINLLAHSESHQPSIDAEPCGCSLAAHATSATGSRSRTPRKRKSEWMLSVPAFARPRSIEPVTNIVPSLYLSLLLAPPDACIIHLSSASWIFAPSTALPPSLTLHTLPGLHRRPGSLLALAVGHPRPDPSSFCPVPPRHFCRLSPVLSGENPLPVHASEPLRPSAIACASTTDTETQNPAVCHLLFHSLPILP